MADPVEFVEPAAPPAITGERSTLQETLRQLNDDVISARQNGGKTEDVINKPKPVQQQVQPGQPAAKPATQAPAAPPKPAEPFKPKAAETLNKDKNTPQPAAVVPKTDPAQPAGEPLETPPGQGAPASAPPVEANPEVIFSERLSSLTDGHIKTTDDFVGLVQHYNELLAQAEEGFKPKFKDERAALVHKILAENAGREPEAAMRTLRAMSFKPEGKSSKDILFQAYLLDPKNSDLSELQAKDYFEAEYSEKYSGLDPDNSNENAKKIAQRNQDLEVKEALANITKIQSDFKAVDEKPAAIAQDVEVNIKKAVENFGGIRIAFTDNPQENDYLNVAINDPKELAAIQEMALNPVGEWNQFMDQFQTEKGFDYPNYVRAYYERTHAVELRQKAYDHGFTAGKLAQINTARNASDPKQIHQAGGPAAGAKPKSFNEAWLDAAKKAG